MYGLHRICHRLGNHFSTHLMELLADVGHMESHFGPFGDIVNLGARLVQDLNRMYRGRGNCFGRNLWNSLVTWGPFGDSVNLGAR